MTSPLDNRVGDTERERYVDHLAVVYSQGFLKEQEFRERRDKALAAVTVGDLATITHDLPDIPPKSKRRVRYCMGSGGKRKRLFSPVRWYSVMMAGLALIILPGPLLATAFHGIANTPAKGTLPTQLIFLGVTVLVLGGIFFGPAETEWIEEN